MATPLFGTQAAKTRTALSSDNIQALGMSGLGFKDLNAELEKNQAANFIGAYRAGEEIADASENIRAKKNANAETEAVNLDRIRATNAENQLKVTKSHADDYAEQLNLDQNWANLKSAHRTNPVTGESAIDQTANYNTQGRVQSAKEKVSTSYEKTQQAELGAALSNAMLDAGIPDAQVGALKETLMGDKERARIATEIAKSLKAKGYPAAQVALQLQQVVTAKSASVLDELLNKSRSAPAYIAAQTGSEKAAFEASQSASNNLLDAMKSPVAKGAAANGTAFSTLQKIQENQNAAMLSLAVSNRADIQKRQAKTDAEKTAEKNTISYLGGNATTGERLLVRMSKVATTGGKRLISASNFDFSSSGAANDTGVNFLPDLSDQTKSKLADFGFGTAITGEASQATLDEAVSGVGRMNAQIDLTVAGNFGATVGAIDADRAAGASAIGRILGTAMFRPVNESEVGLGVGKAVSSKAYAPIEGALGERQRAEVLALVRDRYLAWRADDRKTGESIDAKLLSAAGKDAFGNPGSVLVKMEDGKATLDYSKVDGLMQVFHALTESQSNAMSNMGAASITGVRSAVRRSGGFTPGVIAPLQ